MSHVYKVLILLLLASSTVIAEDYIALTAGANPYPPYIDESHPHGGVAVQLSNAALNTQGYSVTNTIMPWARAIEETKKGRIDFVLDAWWNQERAKVFEYSRAYINGPIKFIKRKGDTFNFTDINSLSGKRIALIKNYAYEDSFMNAQNYERFFTNDFLQGAKLLAHNRVDLTLENELVARSELALKAPALLDQFEFDGKVLTDALVYAIVGKANPKHKEIIEAFNQGIDVILKNGTFAAIMSENGLSMPEFLANREGAE